MEGSGVVIDTSGEQVVVEKAQAILRHEYDLHKERTRELKFIAEGGNTLDFNYANLASLSHQSTSLVGHHLEHFGTFGKYSSTQGGSSEISGRPAIPPVHDSNSADNLFLFDAKHELFKGETNSVHSRKKKGICNSEQVSQMRKIRKTKELKESTSFRPYTRRNRSRNSRDASRSSSMDIVNTNVGHESSFLFLGGSRVSKGSISETGGQKENIPSISNVNSATSVELSSVKIAGESETLRISSDNLSGRSNCDARKINTVSNDFKCRPCEAATITVNESSSVQLTAMKGFRGDRKNSTCNGQNSNALVGSKGFDSRTHNSCKIDASRKTKLYSNLRRLRCSDKVKAELEGLPNHMGGEVAIEKNKDIVVDSRSVRTLGYEKHIDYGSVLTKDVEMHLNASDMQNPVYRRRSDDSTVEISSNKKETYCTSKFHGSLDVTECEFTDTTSPGTTSAVTEAQHLSVNDFNLADKAYEDSILKKAQIIEITRNYIAELPAITVPLHNRPKSRWDFVLEEMQWLANDFAQERVWKMTTAAQICRRVAYTSQFRIEERNQSQKLKAMAFSVADSVMQFWRSAEVLRNNALLVGSTSCTQDLVASSIASEEQERSNAFKPDNTRKNTIYGVQRYALKFLCYNSSIPHLQTKEPGSVVEILDSGVKEMFWDSTLTEENLFYAVPSGAMEAYRKSMESHILQLEITYGENEGKTDAYHVAGASGCWLSSKHMEKKRKNLMKLHTSHPSNGGYTKESEQLMLGKGAAYNPNVGSLPTKRARTVSRQRISSHYGFGASGNLPVQTKSDALIGGSSSVQDSPSASCDKCLIPKCTEVRSVQDLGHNIQYDSIEKPAEPKKQKTDNSKKRLETHHFDLNGLHRLTNAKKPKTVASQITNMSNPHIFMNLIGGRNQCRKAKTVKDSSSHIDSEDSWSLLESQALVVHVHDLGLNWCLVSDAIKSTLSFKSMYRTPDDCKERHRSLTERSFGEGVNNAEGSGTPQSYTITLPGVPKGCARQLFQRLLEPIEDETLKSRFENILMKRKTQPNKSQEPHQIQPLHNSFIMALSETIPNNLSGKLLMPLDLCESSQDVLQSYSQGSHSSDLEILDQGAAVTTPTPKENILIQNSTGITDCPSPSGPVRDSGLNVPRASLPVDEQQKGQQNLLSSTGCYAATAQSPDMVPVGDCLEAMSSFTGMPLTKMPNAGDMFPYCMAGMPSSVRMHSGAGFIQGNSMPRAHDALYMQGTQWNSQNVSGFNRLSSVYPSQRPSPPVQTYTGHPQQPYLHASSQQFHAANNLHPPHLQIPYQNVIGQGQIYVNHLDQETEMHHQYIQQQQQFASSSTLMHQPHQPHQLFRSQIPFQPILQPPVRTPISLQQEGKHQFTLQGTIRNTQLGIVGHPMSMQWPWQTNQHFQQSGRYNHPQPQPARSQQQGNLLNGMGRGNIPIHQNLR